MLYRSTTYPLITLVHDIGRGAIGLPELQRPFVWHNAKIRDLFDSLYRGYPCGFLLLWETGAGLKGIGTNGKDEAPSLAIVDGQQRLTSLYAVMTGAEVIRADFTRERIRIAFDPLTERFEVANAATAQDRAFISDVADIWKPGANVFKVAADYLAALSAVRALSAEETNRIQTSIGNLSTLAQHPFNALVLTTEAGVDTVAEVFVRINGLKIPSILSTFGSRRVNLIAHSKGVLYVRGFLQINSTADSAQRIGVVSATTLDTPHRGSVLADTVKHFATRLPSSAIIQLVRRTGLSLDFLREGAFDMTPQGLAQFNQTYSTPPGQISYTTSDGINHYTNPQYYSTSADADQDQSGKINSAEATPYSQLFGNFSYQVIARGQPVTTLAAAGRLAVASVSIQTTNSLNDCLVPLYSARYPGFFEINSFQGVGVGRNHSTVRKPDVGALVFTKIQLAESLQP